MNAKILEQKGLPQSKVLLYVFSTAEGDLESFKVNIAPFTIDQPQIVMPHVFKQLLKKLRTHGIHSYPHHNMLYIVFERGDPQVLTYLNNTVADFTNRFQGVVSYEPSSISTTILSPATDPSHFVIVRSLIYSYLCSYFRSREKSGYVSLTRRAKEGLKAILVCEDIGSSGEYAFKVCRGLRILLEVTPKQRGYIWVDMITQAFMVDEVLRRMWSLSPYEMKKYGPLHGINLYEEYLRRATLSPKERAQLIEEYLRVYGFGDSITIRYYVYIPEADGFDEREILFNRIELT